MVREGVDLPLFSADQLPPVGTARETSRCDFKATYRLGSSPPPYFEMAKDVAAFANASGGVILVGACEAEQKLSKYLPLPEKEADALAAEFSKQVTQRCSPVPMIDPRRIPFESGFVVAVNVWAFPAQPVGVKLSPDKSVEKFGEPCWVFPVRAGIDTIFLRPEQLSMLMLPQHRTTAALLEGIPKEKRRDIKLAMRQGRMSHGGMKTSAEFIDLLEVRPMENAVVVRGAAGSKLGQRPKINLPLDAILSVWSSASGEWTISVRGFLGSEGGAHLFVPIE